MSPGRFGLRCVFPLSHAEGEAEAVLRSGVPGGCEVTVMSAPWSCGVSTRTFSRTSRKTHVSFTGKSTPVTLGETFQRAGYSTHGVVSHVYLDAKHGFDQGFDSWDEANAQGHKHISSPSISDKAIAILGDRGQDKPLFLFLHYFDPHYDYIEHEEQRFSGEYTGKLESLGDNFVTLRNEAKSGAFGPADIQHLNDLYDSEIAFTDHHIGRVFAELQRLGFYDDTLVVLTADHGEELGERPDMDI